MSNRLENQSSPYLLQHAENPVDWYPWCEEAFEKARCEEKPVFLSIGYSTCHWCHVMAHESFEDPQIAGILNDHFVSIKVDREERPDIDSVYMSVCQAFARNGGWPMSIFMTAEQKPFFAGTYFPPESRYGIIGFRDLLLTIADQWKKDREELLKSAERILGYLDCKEDGKPYAINEKLPRMAAEIFSQSFDRRYGGFGSAPKFPSPHNLIFLMLYSHIHHEPKALAEAKTTLMCMRRGGIFDQIGYGFSRYSTDQYYFVPHFEKMLYDNALLIMSYVIAYKASKDPLDLDTAEKTAQYVFREMTGPDGEFYSAQDADSEGEEGKYYVWDYEEVCKVLGKEKGRLFCAHYSVTPGGNYEGKNIPNLLNGNAITNEYDEEIKELYRYRQSRGRLHLDDKILTSWNSLMICAMSMLYRVTGDPQYLLAAKNSCQFIEDNLVEESVLYVSCRQKVRSVRGFLDEYAYYTAALIFLYEVTSEQRYRKRAGQICQEAVRQFAGVSKQPENPMDSISGGFFLYGSLNSRLIMKPKETYDGALPSGNSVMSYCLVRLSQLTDREEYRKMAENQLSFMSGEAEHYPAGYSMFLTALLLYFHPPKKITVVLSEEDCLEDMWCKLPLYADVKILSEETGNYTRLNGKTTFYVCENFTCYPPTNQLDGVNFK